MKRFSRVRSWLSAELKDTWAILSVVGVVATICFFIWRFTPLEDFGLNAFTETLGIALTVVVIERLLKGQEGRRNLPLKAAAYEDVRRLVHEIAYWIRAMFREAVREPSPTSLEELFTKETFEKIASCLNLDAEAPVYPPRPWYKHLAEVADSQRAAAERILERYPSVLDANAYAIVHRLTSTTLELGLKSPLLITNVDIKHGWGRPRLLPYFTNAELLDFPSLLQLHEWVIGAEADLKHKGLKNIQPAQYSFPKEPPLANPPAYLSPEEVSRQGEMWEAQQRETGEARLKSGKDTSRAGGE